MEYCVVGLPPLRWVLPHTGAKVVQFCGWKLHVHPTVSLTLATSAPPPSLPPELLTATSVVSFASSLPLAQERLERLLSALPQGVEEEGSKVSTPHLCRIVQRACLF